MDHLKKTQLALEVCPTSNTCLGVYPSLPEHSLPKLLEYGLKITLNSDDPPMFNTTLTDEYLACCRVFGWGPETLQKLVLNAVDVALLPPTERTELHERFRRDFPLLDS
jgi:adenosine deaminase